jgi:hypothetical protein
MNLQVRLIGFFGICLASLATFRPAATALAADAAPPENDKRAASMLALPSAGKMPLYSLFSINSDERFIIEFRKADTIREKRRIEVPGSKFIWTINPTIVGADRRQQIHLEGYNPAEAHGTGVCDIHFTLRPAGLWLFIVYGDQSSIGCIELVEERDRIVFIATTRKDGKVQGALFQPFTARNLATLRRDKEAMKQYDKYVSPVLALFEVGVL